MSREGPTVLQYLKMLLQENMGYGHVTLHVILRKPFKVELGLLPKAIGVGYYL